tara:strand:+ start:785 stop:1525 length:741 start_codon:yes stop_codon:yes gene_type:complete
MDTFDLKAYLKENYLFEEDTNIPDNILKLVAKTVNQPVDKVEKIVTGKEEVTEEELNEVVMTAITIAGLIPTIMEAIGGLSNWIARNTGNSEKEWAQLRKMNDLIEKKKELVKKLDKANDKKNEDKQRRILAQLIKDRDNRFGSDFGQWMKSAGHKLHKTYVWPIKKLLQGIAFFQKKGSRLKDPIFRERVANILYAATMAGIAGIGILSHLGHLNGVAAVSTTIADGVKEGKSIADIIKGIGLLI